MIPYGSGGEDMNAGRLVLGVALALIFVWGMYAIISGVLRAESRAEDQVDCAVYGICD